MKSIIFIILTSVLFSCSNSQKKNYSLPSDKDINEIVQEIIISDSIPVSINNSLPDTIHYKDRPDLIIFPIKFPFCIDLENFLVCFPNTKNDSLELTPPPPHWVGIDFDRLIERGQMTNKSFFSKVDSAYFVFQNDTMHNFTISGDILTKIYTTTKIKLKNTKDTYFGCTIPIFSSDKSKAYVELTYHCYGLCSYGKSYLLSKEKNHWTILKKEIIWFS